MAVQIDDVIQIGPSSWRVTFSGSTTGLYRLGINGEEVTPQPTEQKFWDIVAFPGQEVVLEVLDSSDSIFTPYHPRSIALGWDRVIGAKYYLVEESVSMVWTERARIEEEGFGFYNWQSAPLLNGSFHTHRVTPIDAAGNAGPSREFTVQVNGYHDDPTPDVAVAYNSGTRALDFTAV